jgi:hypothetical protein
VTPPSARLQLAVDGGPDGAETRVELSFTDERGGVLIDLRHSRFVNQDECEA